MGKTKTKSRSVGDSPKPPITIRSTNVKILDDNIAKLEKAIQAGDVSANPSGTAEETLLSTIGIDGKKYELGPSAENTSYDNTDSGLTATDTQAAIDELSSASGISYDNTDSGLTADNVQSALDEISGNTTLAHLDTTITTNASGLAFIGSDQLTDSINVILAVNVLSTDGHNNAYISTAKRYSGESTNTSLLVTDGSGDPVASAEIGVRIWYAKI